MSLRYNEISDNLATRLLSMFDRDTGSFQKAYWHYKLDADFPSAIFQQGVLVFSLLAEREPACLEFAIKGMLYWAGIQRRDGSFDEWYPNEHSFVATAFTSYAVSESLLVLSDKVKAEERERIIAALKKAGDWLIRHRDTVVLNHTAGAVAVLYNIYLMTKEERYKEAAKAHLEIMRRYQDEEGWFYEYGGADLGYLGVSVDYLAKYYKRSEDGGALPLIEKALNFMRCFVHLDGTYGGEYGSRSTKYLLPHGLKILATKFEVARFLLDKYDFDINPETVDDRYFIFFFLPNFVYASFEKGEEGVGYADGDFKKIFPHSGLIAIKRNETQVICSYKKNGILKVFKDKKMLFSDVGYFATLKGGGRITSAYLNRAADNFLKEEGDKIEAFIRAQFIFGDAVPLGTREFLLLRLFNYTLGRSDWLVGLFNKLVKPRKILGQKKAPFFLERKIVIVPERSVQIIDRVWRTKPLICERFYIEKIGTLMYSPTSQFCNIKELNAVAGCEDDLAARINAEGKFTLTRRIDLNAGSVSCSTE